MALKFPVARFFPFVSGVILAPVWLLAFTPGLAGQVEDPREAEIRELKAMIRALEARVLALEGQSAGGPVQATAGAGGEALGHGERGTMPVEESFTEQTYGSAYKEVEAAPLPEPVDGIDFTGALRYNAVVSGENLETRRGETGLDLFRIGAEGTIDNLLISAEYRFYSYMNTLHHGWIGYDFPGAGRLTAGVSQVPFGIFPYASHSFWFGVPYYIGLEDDYDLGIQYEGGSGPWGFQLGFFKNEELGNAASLDRYSFDLVRVGAQQNEEINQLNARATYTLGRGTDSIHELGISLQGGELFNAATQDRGHHWAGALHLDSRIRRWNFQLELLRYAYFPENPPGVSDAVVEMGAFAESFPVSAAGTAGVANVAYNVPIDWPWLDSLLLYNDFSILFKDEDAFNESILNTTGAAMGKGPLFLYLDLIQARNMVFFENGSLAGGGNESWDTRLNFNIGYYW